jgi:hypothetical protein
MSLTDDDWLQLDQAAAGATSGIAHWPRLRAAIAKVVAFARGRLKSEPEANAMPAIYCHLLPMALRVGRDLGYAIALHGSVRRDLDLIAVPWRADAQPCEVLARALYEKLTTYREACPFDEFAAARARHDAGRDHPPDPRVRPVPRRRRLPLRRRRGAAGARLLPGVPDPHEGEVGGEAAVLEPWQQAIVANLFGWKRPDGTRRFREALIYLPRKNGKTQICAGLATYVLFCDGEPGAEIYSAAADEDQAKIAFTMAKQMVLQEPQLASRAKIVGKAIVYEPLVSSYKPISSIADTKHGASRRMALIDELHVHKDRDLVDVLITSTGARAQPLIIHLTTADYQRPGSICNEKHEYASKVRDGLIDDPSFLPVIYEASREDDWTKPRRPGGRPTRTSASRSPSTTWRASASAPRRRPGYENTFKRLHLNIITEQASRWLAMERWDAGAASAAARAARRPDCFAGSTSRPTPTSRRWSCSSPTAPAASTSSRSSGSRATARSRARSATASRTRCGSGRA